MWAKILKAFVTWGPKLWAALRTAKTIEKELKKQKPPEGPPQ